MGRLILSEFLTLDGVMENPAWTAPYFGPEIGAFKHAELFAADALLQGRVTYDSMAAAWPTRSDPDGYAERINAMPKTVVSTTLQDPTWTNTSVVSGDVAAAVQALKDAHERDIIVFGSGQLAQTLLAAGLVDGLNLLIFPLALGGGERLFRAVPLNFTLTQTQTFPGGVVLLQYAAEKAQHD